MSHILDRLLCAYYWMQHCQILTCGRPRWEMYCIRIRTPAIDRPPLARDNVHHRFNIGRRKICEAKKKKTDQHRSDHGWLLDNGGSQRYAESTIRLRREWMVCRMVRRLQLCTPHVQSGDTYRYKMTVLEQLSGFVLELGSCWTCKVAIVTMRLRIIHSFKWSAKINLLNRFIMPKRLHEMKFAFLTAFRFYIPIKSTVWTSLSKNADILESLSSLISFHPHLSYFVNKSNCNLSFFFVNACIR